METEMQYFKLASLKILWHGKEEVLRFSSAILYVDISDLEKGWFVDISDLDNKALLESLSSSADIKIGMDALTLDGHKLSGNGYMHPNLTNACAAIKGEGELLGYGF